MSMQNYIEPQLSVLVLDFLKPALTRACLESVRRHIKVPYKVIYYHNGPADYSRAFLDEGLVDVFMQSKVNHGLGVGTRDLFAASFSPYSVYLQNDQMFIEDLTQELFDDFTHMLGGKLFLEIKDEAEPRDSGWHVASISLAGQIAGPSVYSERAHFIHTSFYKALEASGQLSTFGAGPYHHGEWREAAIQRYYKEHQLMHVTHLQPLVRDVGIWTIRDCAGGRLHMRTDTKALWWEKPPTEPYVFPELTEDEWQIALAGRWVNGTVPMTYRLRGESFNCWGEQPAPI